MWNSLLRVKKTANNLNIYFIKNTFLAQQCVSSSIVFYITGLSTLKLKHLHVFSSKKEHVSASTVFGFLFCVFLLSYALSYVWLAVVAVL